VSCVRQDELFSVSDTGLCENTTVRVLESLLLKSNSLGERMQGVSS
jgi:hypothetical protein